MIKKQLLISLFFAIIFGASSTSFAQTKQDLILLDNPALLEALTRIKPPIYSKDEKLKNTAPYNRYIFAMSITNAPIEIYQFVNNHIEKDKETGAYPMVKVNGSDVRNAVILISALAHADELDQTGQDQLTRSFYQAQGDTKFDVSIPDEKRSSEELNRLKKRLDVAGNYAAGYGLKKGIENSEKDIK